MKFAVTVISPPDYAHSAAFTEVAESIHYGLRSLGHDSVLTNEGAPRGRLPIVLGSNLLQHYRLPLADDAILYNLEQVQPGSSWFSSELVDIFRRYVLWDYSRQNAAFLEALGVRVAHVVPIGYVKELTRLELAPDPDIDVLFFGSMSPPPQGNHRPDECSWSSRPCCLWRLWTGTRRAHRSRKAVAQCSLLPGEST